MRKSIALLMICVENLKISKYHTFLKKKNQFFLFFAVRTQMKLKKFLKKNNQLRY